MFLYFLVFFKTIFYVFIVFVTILLLFYVLVFWLWDMWDLSFPDKYWILTSCTERRSLNHWTVRKSLSVSSEDRNHAYFCTPEKLAFSSVQLLSRVRLFATPWIAARQASLSITNSRKFTQTHVYRVSDAIQPSHPLSSPSPPAPSPSQHQSLFQWVNSSHEVAKEIPALTMYNRYSIKVC